MSTVSVVIPNFNGQALLEQHLPAVLRSMRNGDELVIVDDCSTDESWEWLRKTFTSNPEELERFDGLVEHGSWSQGTKKGAVLLLQNRQNLRFAMTCNAGVEQASHELVFLLNSDVAPYPQTVQTLADHFASDQVFAVGCLEHERNSGKDEIGGKNTLTFGRGMFAHQRAESFESGETAWASGGSAMFDRQKWLDLGGFDPDYFPAYWEDVDLSYRAKQRGWKVLFDAKAEVDHNHESTNTAAFGQKKMTKMSWQHAQTFVAKNANWKQKLSYLFWQPYWWIKGPMIAPLQLQLLFFIVILLGTILLRFNKLAEVPHGMTWDEAAITYNGWSVATTGRDEWLKKIPISFRSFGDYKAPLAIYVVGAFSRVFGMSLLVTRIPFAISGVFAVLGMMWLTKMLWESWVPKRKPNLFPLLDSNAAALLVGGFIATSSWHIHYSRIGFESGMALNFLIWGIAGVIWLFKSAQNSLERAPKQLKLLAGVFSAGCIAASLYTYHSSKIVAPLLLLLLGFLHWSTLKKNWKQALLWCVTIALMLVPLAADSVFGKGADRFQQSTIFRLNFSTGEKITTFAAHFLAHFTPSYLVQGKTETLRHGDGQFGILYLSEFFLVVIGVIGYTYQWVSSLRKRAPRPSKLFLFSLLWIVIGVTPAAIGVDVPHSNRMLLSLPGFVLLIALGWQWIAENFSDRLIAPAVLGMTVLFQIFFVSSYLNHYYFTFAKSSANDFIDGYAEAIQYVKAYEDEVDQILFTTAYQQPYIYTLISRETDVYQFHNGALIKYLFTDTVSDGDRARHNTLLVGTPKQLEPRPSDKLIFSSDGKVKFVIVKTP